MEVKVAGPVFDPSGYATATRTLVLQLLRRGFKVQLEALPWGRAPLPLPASVKALLEKAMQTRTERGPRLNFCIAPHFRREPGRGAIGYTMLETDGVPPHWVQPCQAMDEVWVPSDFNRWTFSRSGVNRNKIHVLPLGVDTTIFSPEAEPFRAPGVQGFIFFSNFEWVWRKGYDILLRAFAEEFAASPDVYLLLRTYSNGPDFDPSGRKISQWLQQFLRGQEKILSRILLLPGVYDDRQMASFYTGSHCYILPTRGEGWNLPALEAMACGRPVVTTGWSAQLQFLTEENSYLIPSEGLEPVPELGIPNDRTYAGTRWAKPSLTATRALMRYVVEHYEEAKKKAERARQDVLANYTLDKWIDAVGGRLLAFEHETRDASGKGAKVARPGTLPLPARSLPSSSTPAKFGPTWVGPNKPGPVKIGLVVPSWGRPCGVAEYSQALVAALEKEGTAVSVYSGPLANLFSWSQEKGVRLLHFQYEYSLYDNALLAGLLDQLRSQGIGLLATLHSYSPALAALNETIFRRFDLILVHSPQVAGLLRAGSLPGQRLRVIPMGVPAVPLGDREETRRRLGLESKRDWLPLPLGGQGGGPAFGLGARKDRYTWSLGSNATPANGLVPPGLFRATAQTGKTRRASQISPPPVTRGVGRFAPAVALGFFGFFFPQKGIIELAQANRLLRRFYPNLSTFLFASIAPTEVSRSTFDDTMRELKTAQLWDGLNLRLGYESLEKLIPLLHAMDVNILPYRENGVYGTSAAVRVLIAAQRPIIVTETPFFADLHGPVFKIPSSDPLEITRAVQKILSDPALAEKLVEASRRYQKENDWRQVARLHQEIYPQVTGEGAS